MWVWDGKKNERTPQTLKKSSEALEKSLFLTQFIDLSRLWPNARKIISLVHGQADLRKALALCCQVPGRASRAWYFHRPGVIIYNNVAGKSFLTIFIFQFMESFMLFKFTCFLGTDSLSHSQLLSNSGVTKPICTKVRNTCLKLKKSSRGLKHCHLIYPGLLICSRGKPDFYV